MKAIVPAWRAHSLSNNWFNEFDQMFETLFDQQSDRGLRLATDVEESENYFLFSFDLPGMTEEDFNIEMNDGVLTVSGERKVEVHDKEARHYRGRRYGNFKHQFRLPKTVDTENIEADYTNGVLKVLLPKHELAKPKKIEVKAKRGHLLSGLLKGKESA